MTKTSRSKQEKDAIALAKAFFSMELNKYEEFIYVVGGSCFLRINMAQNARQYAGNPRPDIIKVVKSGKQFKCEIIK
jgi:hypothetical protein